MKLSTFDMMRVWAMVTGLVLAVVWFAAQFMGVALWPTLHMAVVAIGGFELFHYAQDLLLRQRSEPNG